MKSLQANFCGGVVVRRRRSCLNRNVLMRTYIDVALTKPPLCKGRCRRQTTEGLSEPKYIEYARTRSSAPSSFFFDCAGHKEKRSKKEMPLSGAPPLTPLAFLKKSEAKNFSAGCGAKLTIKSKPVGTQGPTGFFLIIQFTAVECRKLPYSFIFSLQEVFWLHLFFKKGGKNL